MTKILKKGEKKQLCFWSKIRTFELKVQASIATLNDRVYVFSENLKGSSPTVPITRGRPACPLRSSQEPWASLMIP